MKTFTTNHIKWNVNSFLLRSETTHKCHYYIYLILYTGLVSMRQEIPVTKNAEEEEKLLSFVDDIKEYKENQK